MEEITGIELYELLKKKTGDKIENYTVELESPLDIDITKVTNIEFHNCTFIGEEFRFVDYRDEASGVKHSLSFDNCIFKNKIFRINSCSLYSLSMSGIEIENTIIEKGKSNISKIYFGTFPSITTEIRLTFVESTYLF